MRQRLITVLLLSMMASAIHAEKVEIDPNDVGVPLNLVTPITS